MSRSALEFFVSSRRGSMPELPFELSSQSYLLSARFDFSSTRKMRVAPFAIFSVQTRAPLRDLRRVGRFFPFLCPSPMNVDGRGEGARGAK